MRKTLDKGNGQDPGTYRHGISGHDVDMTKGEAFENKKTKKRTEDGQTRKHPPKAPALPRRLYDLKAIADYLGIPVYSVRGLIWNGSLPCVRIGRRQYLDLKDVDRFIESQKECE